MQTHANPTLLALLLSFIAAAIAIAVPHPINPLLPNQTQESRLPSRITHPHFPQKRDFTLKIKDLPDCYTSIFTTFVSICPKIPATATFIRFFKTAAAQSATDTSPGRRHQRFTFGALALELVVKVQNEVASKEFVQAASLWLLDAATKGWTGFFRAWVTDGIDNEVVEIRMGTVFDMPAADTWDVELQQSDLVGLKAGFGDKCLSCTHNEFDLTLGTDIVGPRLGARLFEDVLACDWLNQCVLKA